jgi:hypothetical protein
MFKETKGEEKYTKGREGEIAGMRSADHQAIFKKMTFKRKLRAVE